MERNMLKNLEQIAQELGGEEFVSFADSDEKDGGVTVCSFKDQQKYEDKNKPLFQVMYTLYGTEACILQNHLISKMGYDLKEVLYESHGVNEILFQLTNH